VVAAADDSRLERLGLARFRCLRHLDLARVPDPIQQELDRNGFSLPLLRRLVAIEWFREGPHIANSRLFLWMMSRLLSGASGV
jgi:hypothetical protein